MSKVKIGQGRVGQSLFLEKSESLFLFAKKSERAIRSFCALSLFLKRAKEQFKNHPSNVKRIFVFSIMNVYV